MQRDFGSEINANVNRIFLHVLASDPLKNESLCGIVTPTSTAMQTRATNGVFPFVFFVKALRSGHIQTGCGGVSCRA